MIKKKEKGQVWIETVIYTIIGLALIGTVLAFVSPKISETRDRIVIEQSIETMQALDSKIQEVISEGTGSKRVIQSFNLKRGELIVNPAGTGVSPDLDDITLKISNLKYLYSESGEKINFGRVELISMKGPKYNEVELVLKYNSIRYNSEQINIKTITAASTPYEVSIENKKDGNVNYIDFLIER